ncbi:ATP-binding cassette domain-containing protein [Desulfobacterales bacterium HSG2]|nr:ATP-binding cassette domain-containing protein [Desulfobacterales bacterium HSG2]
MIEVKNLIKYFNVKKAVDNISFTVKKGEILGFLGPNGAGKSTTMRMITGFIPPSAGTAVIGGSDILEDSISARKKIGYLPENAPVYPDMTVFGYLDFCSEIRGFSGSERKRRVEETIEKCFLSEVKFQTIGTLSKGFKQRVCFAQSIIHDPEYLILDEPTDGLDPNQKHEVRLMIRQMSTEKTIILSTHILEEMDAVCTRAIIIANGRIVADDTPSHLRTRSSVHGAISLTLRNAKPEKFLSLARKISGVSSAKLIEKDNKDFKVRIFPKNTDTPIADKIISALSKNKYELKSIFVEQGRLDEVFRTITTGQ